MQLGRNKPREYHLRGSMRVWLRVDPDGTVTALDFDPDSFDLDPYEGLSFAYDSDDTDSGGRDLTPKQATRVARRVETRDEWQLRRIEDHRGNVWHDE